MEDLLADAEAELYTADPDRFTQRRSELVAQAREAGQGDAARRIAALRKPTRSAWAVNRLVRTDPQARPRRLQSAPFVDLRSLRCFVWKIRCLPCSPCSPWLEDWDKVLP